MIRWVIAVSVLFVAGCSGASDGPERAVVSGSVTYQGKPLESGDILFTPVAGNDSPAAGAVITDGQYVTTNKGGVPMGKFQVKITGFRLRPGSGQNGDMQEFIQYIPVKYNERTTLEVDISQDSPEKQYDFDLQ
ncbi:hypothetical protein AB1K70_19530 [Bremerella sp. JC770]|uniref:hypothetical protein n=1 Tax=Bremerella sp. JC770 TaxID=3232137 RepID=UPI003458B727